MAIHAGMMFRRLSRYHGGETVNRSDRQVDPPATSTMRPGGGDGENGRLLVKNVDQVRLGEEWPTPHGQGDEKNQEWYGDARRAATNRATGLAGAQAGGPPSSMSRSSGVSLTFTSIRLSLFDW